MLKSATYKTPSCEGSFGNLTGDIMEYTFAATNEAADTTILLRRMSEYNTYVRMTVICTAAMIGNVDIGYVSQDDDEADVLDFFADGISLATASQSVIALPVAVGFKHDVALTIKLNNVANVGDKVTVFTEFVNVAG